MKYIKIIGARTHNLKNVTLQIPKEKISVISGLSGSGKSSLAFDTLFAEGQRRYVENLSSYARQVIGVIEKPDVDSIEGIPAAISIDQKSIVRSPRSTVGTLTEAYDFLRLLYSKFGDIHCPTCKNEVFSGDATQVVNSAREFLSLQKSLGSVKVYAPVVNNIKGTHKSILERFSKSNFAAIRIDGVEYKPADIASVSLEKINTHLIEVLVYERKIDKITEPELKDFQKAILKALDLAEDLIKVSVNGCEEIFSKHSFCKTCKVYFPPLQPRLFSFNSPYGACPRCQGLGMIKEVQPDLVIPNRRLTLAEGAIRPWTRLAGQNGWLNKEFSEVCHRNGFSMDTPVDELKPSALKVVLYGDGEFEGVVKNLERRYLETDSEYLRSEIEQYMVEKVCDECNGRRLNKFALSVTFMGQAIDEVSDLEVREFIALIKKSVDSIPEHAKPVVLELQRRLQNLVSVGLPYLTLSRSSQTLSGGEAQRIRLGVQFDSFLSGVLYVLDEPTIGLHSADTEKIIDAFYRLRDEGNTVVIVEHDKAVIESADYIFDMGPGAGKAGGYLVAFGSPEEIKKDKNSVTGPFLSGKKKIPYPSKRRHAEHQLEIVGASANNLKDIDVKLPLGCFIAVSGVSGSGKSTLVYDVLAKTLSKLYHRSEETPGAHRQLLGAENLDKVIRIDQSPIGRTPRSNLATYTGLFTPIRELFAATKEANLRAFNASQFSFNLKGGRCETCHGDGMIKVEMFFMPDIYVPCEECQGMRYNRETLDVKYKEKNIAEVLEMSVDEASEFFADSVELKEKFEILKKVGLGYVSLGQSATTLSGGEAQRVKLATELSRPSTGKTIYILDEPTTGLHFEDISKLLTILQELVDRGNTVLVIEHNLDVLKNADWLIDMGPEGGEKGGQIIAEGTPEQVASNSKSSTGKYLKEALN